MSKGNCRTFGGAVLIGLLCAFGSLAAKADNAAPGGDVLKSAGVRGGLIVHVGCGAGKRTARLRPTASYVVHGLDSDPDNVAAARKHIHSKGLYGPVSVRWWDRGRLPYADNLVNMVVVECEMQDAAREIPRVLAPNGVAVVKPPNSMQWKSAPMWCRSHEYNSSMAAMVSANGRMFYIMDQGLRGIIQIYDKNKRFPPRWSLVARNAFNGIKFWKKKAKNSLVPLTLAAANGRVCYHNYSQIVCLDLKTGAERWRSASQERTVPRAPGGNRFRKGNSGILIVYQDVVLFSAKRGLEAFSLDAGKKLWTGPVVESVAPQNCFVSTGLFGAQGAVWPMVERGSIQRRSSAAKFSGYDPKTGKVTKTVEVPSLISRGHHVRCYPGKATERYLLLPKRGAEFLDLVGDNHMRHDWIRGGLRVRRDAGQRALVYPAAPVFLLPRRGPERLQRTNRRRPAGRLFAAGKNAHTIHCLAAKTGKDPLAAFEGRMGSRFAELSIADGKKITETTLDCTPVFDGLIAAGGRLYLATTDGSIICFGRD